MAVVPVRSRKHQTPIHHTHTHKIKKQEGEVKRRRRCRCSPKTGKTHEQSCLARRVISSTQNITEQMGEKTANKRHQFPQTQAEKKLYVKLKLPSIRCSLNIIINMKLSSQPLFLPLSVIPYLNSCKSFNRTGM